MLQFTYLHFQCASSNIVHSNSKAKTGLQKHQPFLILLGEELTWASFVRLSSLVLVKTRLLISQFSVYSPSCKHAIVAQSADSTVTFCKMSCFQLWRDFLVGQSVMCSPLWFSRILLRSMRKSMSEERMGKWLLSQWNATYSVILAPQVPMQKNMSEEDGDVTANPVECNLQGLSVARKPARAIEYWTVPDG